MRGDRNLRGLHWLDLLTRKRQGDRAESEGARLPRNLAGSDQGHGPRATAGAQTRRGCEGRNRLNGVLKWDRNFSVRRICETFSPTVAKRAAKRALDREIRALTL